MKKLPLLLLAALVLSGPFGRASDFVWTGTSGDGLWATPGNWSLNSGFPSGTTDTATINSASANQTITWADPQPGTVVPAGLNLLTLSLTESTTGVTNKLIFDRGNSIGTTRTDITNAVNLSASAGTAEIELESFGSSTAGQVVHFNGGLTLGVGGLLDFNMGTTTSVISPEVFGAVTISGGEFLVEAPTASAGAGARIGSTANSLLSMSSGSIVLSGTDAHTTKLQLDGGLSVTGGTITSSSAKNLIDITGGPVTGGVQANSISGAVFNSATAIFELNGTVNQSLSSQTGFLGGVNVWGISSVATPDIVDTLSAGSVAGGNVGTIVIDDTFSTGPATGSITLQLGSDLTLISGAFLPQGNNTHAGITNIIDTNGHTLDLTAGVTSATNPSAIFTPGSFNTDAWTLKDSGTGGTIKAFGFNLAGNQAGTSVTGDTVLESTGLAAANNLGLNASGTGTISAASTFIYDSGSTSSTGTVTSNRTIGGLTVTGGSRLKVITAGLKAAGNVKVDTATDTLDIGGQALTMTGAANLTGSGTVTSTVAGGTVSFDSGSSGGLLLTATSGALSFTGTLSFSLANAASSSFTIGGTSAFESVNMNSLAITYGGALVLNFTNGFNPTLNQTFDLFTNLGGNATGSFTSVTSNIAGDAFSFDAATGIVTVTAAVPEPSIAWLLALGGAALLFGMNFRRRAPLPA